MAVVHSKFIKHLDGDSLKDYMKWFWKSFTDNSKHVKWCPSPGCEYCVELKDLSVKYVDCKCGKSFCFKCTKEPHRPCSCEIIAKWNLKNTSESENTSWILANTKPCPKCKCPIEKNDGCNHMKC